ncbi:MAG: FeoA family protein [Candidatus Woesearchaeota archaeon]
MKLSELPDNKPAIISCINCKGELKCRLMDMGLIKGCMIKVEREAPLGDPLHLKIKGYSLSLRKEEAQNIEVMLLNEIKVAISE